MSKKRNPFRGYQDEIVASRKKQITRVLASLHKSKATYPGITNLAKVVAGEIRNLDGSQLSHVTLLRNDEYSMLLDQFMASRPGLETHRRGRMSDSASMLQVKTANLENSNLRKHCGRLEARIRVLEQELEVSNKSGNGHMVVPSAEEPIHSADHKAGFELACSALHRIIVAFRDFVIVDKERSRILDKSVRPPAVIVDSNEAEPFIEWLFVNEGRGI